MSSPLPASGRRTGPPRTDVRGYAVLEGVLLCSPTAVAVAVRRPSGEVVVRAASRRPWLSTALLARLPLLRAWAALIDLGWIYLLALGFALVQAELTGPLARAHPGAARLPPAVDAAGQRARVRRTLGAWLCWTALALVLVLGGVPLICADLTRAWLGLGVPYPAALAALMALLAPVAAVVLLSGYTALVGRTTAVGRLLMYHGAEHQVRAALAAGAPMTLAAVRRFAAVQPSCSVAAMTGVLLLGFLGCQGMGALLPEFGAQLAAAGRSWSDLGAAVALRLGVMVLAVGPYEELRRLLGPTLHAGPLGARLEALAERLCAAAVVPPDPRATEVAIVAMRALLDAERAVQQAGGGMPAMALGGLADACVRGPSHTHRATAPCAGDKR